MGLCRRIFLQGFSRKARPPRIFLGCTRWLHDFSRPLSFPSGHTTLLPLVYSCSNLSLTSLPGTRKKIARTRHEDGSFHDEEVVVPLALSLGNQNLPYGYLRPCVLEKLQEDSGKHILSPWSYEYDSDQSVEHVDLLEWHDVHGRVPRGYWINELVRRWRKEGVFEDILRGWSDEDFPVFHHTSNSPEVEREEDEDEDPLAFTIERAALPLFGFPNFGSLLIAYYAHPSTGKHIFWIPRRSMNKRTWPGRLDVTVGGGIRAGDSARGTIIKEAAEEACLDSTFVSRNILSTGLLPFPNRSPAGWLLPGMYYLYEIELPSNRSIRPETNAADGEVESFEEMDAATVLENLLAGKFKSSSALAMVYFFIRHGYITAENEPRIMDVCRGFSSEMTLPVPWSVFAVF